MNRSDFKQLARSRLEDARVLIQASRFDGAYYLFGLAVECALKACICRKVQRFDFPNKKLTDKSYQHDLLKLVEAAGLEATRLAMEKADVRFAANWAIVKDWSIEDRYVTTGQSKAEALEKAISDRRHGVMRWIRQHW